MGSPGSGKIIRLFFMGGLLAVLFLNGAYTKEMVLELHVFKAREFVFQTEPGRKYQIQRQTEPGIWQDQGNEVPGDGGLVIAFVRDLGIRNQPYRVIEIGRQEPRMHESQPAFEFVFQSKKERKYQIQSTSDMKIWEDHGIAFKGEGGPVSRFLSVSERSFEFIRILELKD